MPYLGNSTSELKYYSQRERQHDIKTLYRRWGYLLKSSRFIGVIDETESQMIFNTIQNSYMDKRRKYHNPNHIVYMLNLLYSSEEKGYDFFDKEALTIAVFFHDIVYNTNKHYYKNEEESAKLCRRLLSNTKRRHGLETLFIDRVCRYIESTKIGAIHSFMTGAEAKDVDILHDLDYAYLGGDYDDFLENSRKIAKEFSILKRPLFWWKRHTFLKSLLKDEPIYRTNLFIDAREVEARVNIFSFLND